MQLLERILSRVWANLGETQRSDGQDQKLPPSIMHWVPLAERHAKDWFQSQEAFKQFVIWDYRVRSPRIVTLLEVKFHRRINGIFFCSFISCIVLAIYHVITPTCHGYVPFSEGTFAKMKTIDLFVARSHSTPITQLRRGLDLGFTAVQRVEFPQMSELQELSLRITKMPLRQATYGATVGVTERFWCSLASLLSFLISHTRTHTHIYIYIHVTYTCACF